MDSHPAERYPREGALGNRMTRFARPVLLVATGCALILFPNSLFWLPTPWRWIVSAVVFGLWLFTLSFFRNPKRAIPTHPDRVLSAADGRVMEVQHVERETFLDGPATRILVFLSVFDVHVNRAPVTGRVSHLEYRRGRFKSATSAAARDVNECQELGQTMADGTRVLTRQIAGLIARRIICPVVEDDELEQGFDYGMIRFGSQTEVSIPDRDGRRFEARVAPGDAVRGGLTVLGQWVEVTADVGTLAATAGSKTEP